MVDETRVDPADAPETGDAPAPARDAASGERDDALAAAQRDRDEYYDRLLRKTAEFDNYRKRIERERREQADQAVVDLLMDVLLVVDDFERALTVDAGDGGDAYRKGVELIYAKLQDLLHRRGIRSIDAVGADFDPHLHQAVTYDDSPGHRDGEVVAELRKGYMLGERLLRPAMVKVAKA